MSLRAKLLLGALLVLVPIFGLLLVAFEASYDRRRDIVLESLLQTAEGAAALVDATFDEAIVLGRAIASDPAIRSLDPERVTPRLERLATGYNQYESFLVFDELGELRGVSDPVAGTALNVADRPYFRRVLEAGQPTVIELISGRRTGRPATGVAVPIHGEVGGPIGVLVIGFNLDRLERRIAQVGLYGDQVVALFDPAGQLALRATELPAPAVPGWEPRDYSAVPALLAALAGEAVSRADFESPVDGREWAIGMVRSQQHGWVAAALWPAAEAFAPAAEARRLELATFAVIALTSIIGAVVLASSLTRPVRRLANGALALGRGELDRRVDIRTGDELETLGHAFNAMAGHLQASLTELEAARIAAEAGRRAAEASRAEAEAAERRAVFLAEAGAALTESLDYEATLQRVAALAVPMVADWCVVDIVERDGSVSRIAAAHADPARAALIDEPRGIAPQPVWEDHPVARVLRTGRPLVLSDLAQPELATMARDPEHRHLLRGLGVATLVIVPLSARGPVMGTITLAMGGSGRRYDDADLTLAESLASRAAIAVENARLHAETRQAVRVRDEFLASASHELRTPISHVKGFVSSLRQPDVEWDEETRRDFLAEIERETDRLAKLIGDLLDMTRLESGGLDEVERAPIAPSTLIEGGLDRVRGLVRGHPVQVDVPLALPAVLGEVSQLERVVANLVENAAKFSPPGGRIRVSAAACDGTLELCVEDEGPGIPPEHMGHVFEEFYRVLTRDRSIPGTGLGLAICRRIVESHGGQIRAENQAHGARFVVELPLAASLEGVAG